MGTYDTRGGTPQHDPSFDADPTITLDQFIERLGLTMHCRRVRRNPNMEDSAGMDHWFCTILAEPKRRLELVYSMGPAHAGRKPTLAEILDCIASDAAGIENAGSFEAWADEYGFDADSRRAERTYQACEEQAEAMRAFFSTAAYETLLWCTERL